MMATLQEAIADFVRDKMKEQNLSTYDVARRSGGAISHATVWAVINRRVAEMKLSTLQALAKAFDINERILLGLLDKAGHEEPSPVSIGEAAPPFRTDDPLDFVPVTITLPRRVWQAVARVAKENSESFESELSNVIQEHYGLKNYRVDVIDEMRAVMAALKGSELNNEQKRLLLSAFDERLALAQEVEAANKPALPGSEAVPDVHQLFDSVVGDHQQKVLSAIDSKPTTPDQTGVADDIALRRAFRQTEEPKSPAADQRVDTETPLAQHEEPSSTEEPAKFPDLQLSESDRKVLDFGIEEIYRASAHIIDEEGLDKLPQSITQLVLISERRAAEYEASLAKGLVDRRVDSLGEVLLAVLPFDIARLLGKTEKFKYDADDESFIVQIQRATNRLRRRIRHDILGESLDAPVTERSRDGAPLLETSGPPVSPSSSRLSNEVAEIYSDAGRDSEIKVMDDEGMAQVVRSFQDKIEERRLRSEKASEETRAKRPSSTHKRKKA